MDEITLYGFGEAGQSMAAGLPWSKLASYDLALDYDRSKALGVRPTASPQAAVEQAKAVFCLVTADAAYEAAQAAAPHLPKGCYWLDGNSCARQTKERTAELITASGGRYVDTAIMAPITSRQHKTPMLVSGPHAKDAHSLGKSLDMDMTVIGERVGQASSIKMFRSVIVKGIEALMAESFLAARLAGVEKEVIASLQASDPETDWAARGSYNMERMMAHGLRRAAEMDEVAKTLRGLGLPDLMSLATRDWQQRVGSLNLDATEDSLPARADQMLDRLR